MKINPKILESALRRGACAPQKSSAALGLFKFSPTDNPFKIYLREKESNSNICNLANIMVIDSGCSWYSLEEKLVQRFRGNDYKTLQNTFEHFPNSVLELAKFQPETGGFLSSERIKKIAPLHHKEPKIVNELLNLYPDYNFITKELVDECKKDLKKTISILERFNNQEYNICLDLDKHTGTVIKLMKNKNIENVITDYKELEKKFFDKIENEKNFLFAWWINKEGLYNSYWRAHHFKKLELIQVLDKKTIEKLLKDYDFEQISKYCNNYLDNLNYSDLKLAEKMINSTKINGQELTEHEKLCVLPLLNLYKKSNIPTNNLKKMVNINKIDIQEINMDVFKATMKNLGLDSSKLVKLEDFITKNPKYSFLKFNKTEHFEYLDGFELEKIFKNPHFDLLPEYGIVNEQNLTMRLTKIEQLEKIFPDEIKKLKETTGNSFYNIKWESFENINNETLKEMNEGFKFLLTVNANKAGRMNFDYAKKMINIKNEISSEIISGGSFDNILESTAKKYQKENKNDNMGKSRKIGANRLYTVYYENVYSEYYTKLKSIIGKQQSPNENFALTKINNTFMNHPNWKNIDTNLDFAKQNYKNLLPLIEKVNSGQKLTNIELEKANNDISEIMYVLSHTTPYCRGSNGIANIFIRSLYQSLGINLPALKNGVSLDLEAFCSPTLDIYKKNWKTFFVKDIGY